MKIKVLGIWRVSFAQVLFPDTNDDKVDLTLFEDAMHQIAKLTSHTVDVKGLTEADIKSILFTSSPINISYNRRSKVVENVNCHVIIDISSSFCCCLLHKLNKSF